MGIFVIIIFHQINEASFGTFVLWDLYSLGLLPNFDSAKFLLSP